MRKLETKLTCVSIIAMMVYNMTLLTFPVLAIEMNGETAGAIIETVDYSSLDFYEGDNSRISTYATLPSSVDLSETIYFPEIDAQLGLNSCTAFATTYYQYSYEVNKLNEISTISEQSVYSPKWVYNLLNGGSNTGIGVVNAYAVLKNFGSLKSEDLPYDGVDYTSIPNNMESEKIEALQTRLESFGTLSLPNSGTFITSPADSDLTGIKTALKDGKVLVTTTLEFDGKSGYGEYSGITTFYRCKVGDGGHAMAVVGYDDNFCCDFNNNGTIEESEKGAFKLANSYGENSQGGYVWIMYDALNAVSANTSNNWESNLSGVRKQALKYSIPEAPTFWYINVAKKDVYYIGEADISSQNFDDLKLGVTRTSNSVTNANNFNYIEPFSTMMKTTVNPRLFDGLILWDCSSYMAPVAYYLSGYNLHASIVASDPDNVSSRFRIIDSKGNEIVGYEATNSSMANLDLKYKTINTKIGDMNYNGIWDQADAMVIQEYMAQIITLSTLQKTLADANQNGRIEMADAVYILSNLEG